MLDTTINELFDHLRNRFPANRDYSKAEIRHELGSMPEPLAHYLTKQINEHVTRHTTRIASDTWIDSTNSEVGEALDQLSHALEHTTRIPADEWPDVLSTAVREIMTYLVDPVGELTNFVFRDRASLRVEEVQQRMAYFSPYSYLHSVFTAYTERKSLNTIDRQRFKEVLQRIDRQMIEDYTVEKWERLFEPLFEVMEITTTAAEEAHVPTPLLRQLAAQKQFEALLGELDRLDTRRMNRQEVQHAITRALEQPEPSTAQQPPQAQPEQEPRTPEGPQPRWKQFQQNKQSPRPSSRSKRETSRSPRRQSDESARPLWQRFQQSNSSKADPHPQNNLDRSSSRQSPDHNRNRPPQDSLNALERQVIGPVPNDQRERFVQHLFSGSQEKYTDILEKLQNVNSWERASSLIAEKVFLPHQVNIYSEPAVTFTDLVEARFRQTSSVR